MTYEIEQFGFLDVLHRGTLIEIGATDCHYFTTAEILDATPVAEGLLLTLDGPAMGGELEISHAMIATATYDGDCWEIHHGNLVFRFEDVETEPAFGPDGFFTKHPEAWEEHRRAVTEREAQREAKRREQHGWTPEHY